MKERKLPLPVKLLLTGLFLFAVICVMMYVQNNRIEIDTEEISPNRLPQNLEGLRIVHLSDLHNRRFGAGQKKLISAVKEAKPDLIFVTGDFVNRKTARKDGGKNALEALEAAVEIAPVYFVSGNNEWQSGIYEQLMVQIEDLGVHVLENRCETISWNGADISVTGISDIYYLKYQKSEGAYRESYFTKASEHPPEEIEEMVSALPMQSPKNSFRILLTHRPEWMEDYAQRGFDLMMCGHAHGGQVRLPLIGPLFAPQQGLFPKITEGIHPYGEMLMCISRGLGNNGIPLRLFNDPEVKVIILKKI